MFLPRLTAFIKVLSLLSSECIYFLNEESDCWVCVGCPMPSAQVVLQKVSKFSILISLNELLKKTKLHNWIKPKEVSKSAFTFSMSVMN